VENFKTPNFELVADVLYWMVRRYDPDITVHSGIESEDDRVEFLTQICGAVLSRAGIRLNLKKLYAADGHAVKELLKVAETLYSAAKYSAEGGMEDIDDVQASVTSRFGDVKAARALASEITERGVRLHDLLKAEMTIRGEREVAMKFLERMESNLGGNNEGSESRYIEKSLTDIIDQTRENVDRMKKQVEELTADGIQLQEKIGRKTTDLERNKKRLASLQHVRPAFMDEYEKFERELIGQYGIYLERFRNLDYLEHELDVYNASAKERHLEADKAMKRMQKRLRDEEFKVFRGENEGILDDENSNGAAGNKSGGGIFGQRMDKNGGGNGLRDNSNGQQRQGNNGGSGGGNYSGKMNANSSEESDSEDLSDEDLTHDSNDSDDVSVEGSVSGSSESSNDLIENDDGSDSDSSDGGEGGGGGNFDEEEGSGSDNW
jgi:clusterin-associated protein 1